MQRESSPDETQQAEPDPRVFYDPEWLGLVVGMRELWKTDMGAILALRTCTGWTRGASAPYVRTRLWQVWVLLQDVRRHYHADRAEKTSRFKRVGGFRDVVARLEGAMSHQQDLLSIDDTSLAARHKALGGTTRNMVETELRMRRGMHWYRAHWDAIDHYLEVTKP